MRMPTYRFISLVVLVVQADTLPRAWAEGPCKKVLVELDTSRGCPLCPPNSPVLGKLAELGYETERIVPIGFQGEGAHDHWTDPLGQISTSRRGRYLADRALGSNDCGAPLAPASYLMRTSDWSHSHPFLERIRFARRDRASTFWCKHHQLYAEHPN